MIEKAILILDDKDNDLFKVADDFDLQMGEDGKGDALLQAIDHPTSGVPTDIIYMLCAWATEPTIEEATHLTECTFLAHATTLSAAPILSQDSSHTANSVPGVWFWK